MAFKKEIVQWIEDYYAFFQLDSLELGNTIYFKLIDTQYDPPIEIFLYKTVNVIELGFEVTQWDGPAASPLPARVLKNKLPLESIIHRRRAEVIDIVSELIIKTINSRKRQYRICQFCRSKTPTEHRFDKDTCHGCATQQYGVVY